MIARVSEIGKFEEKIPDASNVIYIGTGEKSSFVIFKRYHNDTRENAKNGKHPCIRLDEGNKLSNICFLYREFIAGKTELDHNARFLLLTNLRFIESGRKKFFRYLRKHTNHIEEWEYQADYIKKMDYKPQSCSPGCPYCEDCLHKENLVLTVQESGQKIIRVEKNKIFCTVDEAYRRVYQNIVDSIKSPEKGLYLITAQTSVGKTAAYCDIVGNDKDRRFMIAVPTNMLKKEVSERLRYSCKDMYVTPSFRELGLPETVIEYIQYGYKCGYYKVAARAVQKYVKENRRTNDPEIQASVMACEDYLKMGNELQTYPRVVVTTHARLLDMPEELLQHYTVIVDEDILMTIFQSMGAIEVKELEAVLEMDDYSPDVKIGLERILETEAGKYAMLPKQELMVDELAEHMDFPAWGLFQAASCHIDENREWIYYFIPQMLPAGKYIILSATLKKEIYELYFRNHSVYQCWNQESLYKGKLVQYTAHSLSRRDCVEKFDRVLAFARKTFSAK